jgi:acetyl esterase/lipase
MQKPSTLWPPPSDEMTRHVHATLRSRIRHMVHLDRGQKYVDLGARPKNAVFTNREKPTTDGMPVDVGSYTAPPALNSPENQTISIVATSGETLTIDQQVHLYTQNSLVVHPLISPVLSYLGGLPPLLFIAGNGEVLRDEIIYTCEYSWLS